MPTAKSSKQKARQTIHVTAMTTKKAYKSRQWFPKTILDKISRSNFHFCLCQLQCFKACIGIKFAEITRQIRISKV